MVQRRIFSKVVNFSFHSCEYKNNPILLLSPEIVQNREIEALFSNRTFLSFKTTFFSKGRKEHKVTVAVLPVGKHFKSVRMWRGKKNHILKLCHCSSAGKILESRKMFLFSYILNVGNGSIGKPLSPRKDIPLRKIKNFPALSNHMPCFHFYPLTDKKGIC